MFELVPIGVVNQLKAHGPATTGLEFEANAMARTRSQNYDAIHLGILTHAAALFSAQGYTRSSIADLADACKLSRGALYHYFDSKEAILFAILDRKSVV